MTTKRLEALEDVGRTYKYNGVEVIPSQALAHFMGKKTEVINQALKRLGKSGRLIEGADYFVANTNRDIDPTSQLVMFKSNHGLTLVTRLAANTLTHYFEDEKSVKQSKEINRIATAVMDQAKKPVEERVSLYAAAASILENAHKMAVLIGLDGNQARLTALRTTKAETGLDIQDSLKIQFKNESQEREFLPSELGSIYGISGQKFNKLLEASGFQDKLGDKWTLTDTGKKFGIYFDQNTWHLNGSTKQGIRWKESVLKAMNNLPKVQIQKGA